MEMIIYQPHIDQELQSLADRIYPPRWIMRTSTEYYWRWCRCSWTLTSSSSNPTFPRMVYGSWKALFECRSRMDETSSESEKVSAQENMGMALEMTSTDRPGLLSEISAVLLDLGCNVTSVRAWTHNDRAAFIIYVEDAHSSGPIRDPKRLAQVEYQLENVVEAHHGKGGQRRSVRFTTFAASGGTHAERRLHQLMYADRDYERCRACDVESNGEHKKGCDGTHVSVGRCQDKGYWVVNVRSKDRPKLLFDTVCVLTDMQYVVFHAAIRSKGGMADQEYFVRHADNDNSNLDTESERHKLTLCLIAAIERRVSHASLITPSIKMQGLRVDLRTQNRKGLVSDVTRVFRENGLSISRAEIGTQGEKAVGWFYVRDYTGQEVNPNIVELVREETGGCIVAIHKSPHRVNQNQPQSLRNSSMDERPRRFSFGSMLWSRLSGNLRLIRYST
ncbi:ACT domain-containing protein ACR1 isoform X1 [Senna tora]|uniref:ACT domain-containing protein ACR n=1 Tax=Senna tora TaxID=362788 RepID=A0A834W5C4_9FABA|nr:ACT domain-containing protein ACR1 isoform X1 [Senna tora]